MTDLQPQVLDCLLVVNVIYVYCTRYKSLMSSSSAAAIGSAYENSRAVQRITDNNAAV